MEGQSRHGRGSQDAHPNTSDQAHRDFAQPPSIEGTPSPSAAGASHGQAPVREPNAASRTPAKDAMEVGAARPPSSSRSGAVQQGIASPLKGNSPARSRGGSDGGHPEVMQRWTEEMLRTLEECQDETADELVTTRLALRNMVKLSRMPGCSKDKVDEYRRLLGMRKAYSQCCANRSQAGPVAVPLRCKCLSCRGDGRPGWVKLDSPRMLLLFCLIRPWPPLHEIPCHSCARACAYLVPYVVTLRLVVRHQRSAQ